jgi:hypothetical protein
MVGSSFPVIAKPGSTDEPPHDDVLVGEGDQEVDDPPMPCGTPERLLGAL